MTENQLVALGDYSESILRDDRFQLLRDQFERQLFTAMMATKPDQKQVREDIYAQVLGFNQFIGLMTGYVEQARDIRAREEAKADPYNQID